MREINRTKTEPKNSVKSTKKTNKSIEDGTSKSKKGEGKCFPNEEVDSCGSVDTNMVVHHVHQNNKSPESKSTRMSEPLQEGAAEEESDCETLHDSVSSQGDSHSHIAADDERQEAGTPKASRRTTSRKDADGFSRSSRLMTPTSNSLNKKKTRFTGKTSPGTAKAEPKEKRYPNFKDEEIQNDAETEEDLVRKLEETERKNDEFKDELRVVAALEIGLYSAVPEHGCSSHKVHTPARRLSRFCIHAWTEERSFSKIGKNLLSGLILVARACGSDAPRLTFWLSNTVVLREIISETNGRTLTGALEKVESWIFSRIVESIWWQSFTPNMQQQSQASDAKNRRGLGRPAGPALGDHRQGYLSIDLWNSAFQDAFQRICPLRGAGHKCGCLPVITKMVMEHCAARLDVAMFNAILRETSLEIPTDPVSDPIVDSKVLPVPAGDLSFGSGAQLKNAVGNWSRLLTGKMQCWEDDDPSGHFRLLNGLSDLLMLPKDMIVERSVRMEVCPFIGLPLIKRILCNFTPDEFCPDPVPGPVLESLNAESVEEEDVDLFPRVAAPVSYSLPSTADVGEKVAEVGGGGLGLDRNVSCVRMKGYTSDEELEEMESPLSSIIHGSAASMRMEGTESSNSRYHLLRQVWW